MVSSAIAVDSSVAGAASSGVVGSSAVISGSVIGLGHAVTSIALPQWLHTRTRRPSSRTVWRTRVGSLQLGQTSITFDTSSGCAMSRMPPCWTFGARSVRPWVWRGLVWRLAMLMPSMTTAIGRDEAGFQKPVRAFWPFDVLLHRGHPLARRGVRQHALDHALLAGVLAGQHDDGVALADLGHAGPSEGHHSTSGASETIFM